MAAGVLALVGGAVGVGLAVGSGDESAQTTAAVTAVTASTVTTTQADGGSELNPFGGEAEGAPTPEEAVLGLVEAVELRDPLGALALLAPGERKLLADVYTTLLQSAQREGMAGDEEALTASLELGLAVGDLTVTTLSDHSAWVEAGELRLRGRFLPGVLDEAAGAFHGLAAAVDYGYWWGIPDVSELDATLYDSGVAAIEVDGLWYVSALHTAAEIARRELELPYLPADPVAAAPSGSPEEAVRAFLSALADKDLRAAAAGLVAEEGLLFSDYDRSLGAWGAEQVLGVQFTVAVEDLVVVEASEESAVVEVPRWSASAAGRFSGDDYFTSRFSGQEYCADWEITQYETDQDSGCLFIDPRRGYGLDGLSLLADQGWRGPRIVAVKSGDGWVVSLLETVRYTLMPFAEKPTFALLWLLASSDDEQALIISAASEGAPILQNGGSVEAELIAADRVAVARGSFGSGMTTVVATPDVALPVCSLSVWQLAPFGRSGLGRGVGKALAATTTTDVPVMPPREVEWVDDAPCGTPTTVLPPGEYLLWVRGGWMGIGPAPFGRVTLTAQRAG